MGADACRPSSVSSRVNASSAATRSGRSPPSLAAATGGDGVTRKDISPSATGPISSG